MDETRFLDLARQIMSLPTAPFHEHFVAEYVEGFARSRSLDIAQDQYGNLLLRYEGRPRKTSSRPRLIATAHLDHPGLGFPQRRSAREYLFEKLGGVAVDLAGTSGVRIYSLDRPVDQVPVEGRIAAFRPATKTRPAAFAVRVADRRAGVVGPGSFAMWDLERFRKQGRLLRCRACDDLGGAAAGLAFLDEVCRRRLSAPAGLLLTRAEEGGFGGMLGATRSGLLERDALYINIECSSAKAGAALGAGPVVRVGDRRWIFDSVITGALTAAAAELAASDSGFRYQRRLMDSGTCEATVLARARYLAGAVALPMRNYHNDGGRSLRAEVVHLDDALGLVKLLVRLTGQWGSLQAVLTLATRTLDADLARLHRNMTPRLEQTRDRKRNRR